MAWRMTGSRETHEEGAERVLRQARRGRAGTKAVRLEGRWWM